MMKKNPQVLVFEDPQELEEDRVYILITLHPQLRLFVIEIGRKKKRSMTQLQRKRAAKLADQDLPVPILRKLKPHFMG